MSEVVGFGIREGYEYLHVTKAVEDGPFVLLDSLCHRTHRTSYRKGDYADVIGRWRTPYHDVLSAWSELRHVLAVRPILKYCKRCHAAAEREMRSGR